MQLVRFDLPQEMEDLRREVNRVFSLVPSPIVGAPTISERWMPALDTVQQDDKLHITVDLPGLDDTDIDVEVKDDLLFIRGRREIEREESGQEWHRFERSSGEFERCLQMPEGIDPKQVTAAFDKGVLHVTIPVPEAVAPVSEHIEITTGSGG